MSHKNGGQAFPRSPHSGDSSDDGMSLRDYFAAAALQGITSNPNFFGAQFQQQTESAAEFAYECADAMLRARES